MNTSSLRQLGLSENEIKLYLALLQGGSATAYDLGKKTGIYRVHVYDKIENLMNKGLVTHIYRGAKKYFQAIAPAALRQVLEDKKNILHTQEQEIETLIPLLEQRAHTSQEDTHVEVFKGVEGLKHFLKDIIKTKKEVLVTGIDDAKYQEALPIFMEQYFRDLRIYKIKERILTLQKKDVFQFDKKTAPTTEYRYLEEKQFNPANTFIYGSKVVLVSWGTPVTAVMIENAGVAATYKGHFEVLWKISAKKP
ncbi:MAG: helix-turn-helix domain-containing protein [Nanoarchaeota archaeon]